MSDPYAASPWAVPVTVAREPRIQWGIEVLVAAVVTAYSALLGGLVGWVWPQVAPHVDMIRAAEGSEVAATALLHDDLWLAVLGAAAGVVAVTILLVSFRDAGQGPGAVIGLVAGGLLGSLIAAHLGHHTQRPMQLAYLKAHAPGFSDAIDAKILHYFVFEVRAKGVLLAWPIAAVLLHGLTVLIAVMRGRR
jgi:hypothetical protein